MEVGVLLRPVYDSPKCYLELCGCRLEPSDAADRQNRARPEVTTENVLLAKNRPDERTVFSLQQRAEGVLSEDQGAWTGLTRGRVKCRYLPSASTAAAWRLR